MDKYEIGHKARMLIIKANSVIGMMEHIAPSELASHNLAMNSIREYAEAIIELAESMREDVEK